MTRRAPSAVGGFNEHDAVDRLLIVPPGLAAVVDPSELFARLRAGGPAQWNEALSAWVVTSYDGCLDLLRAGAAQPPAPSKHLKSLVAQVLTVRRVERLRDRVGFLVDSYLDEVESEPAIDVVARVAAPVAVSLLGDLIGAAPSHRRLLARELPALTAGTVWQPTPAERCRADEARSLLTSALTDLVEHRRDHPGPDLVSALLFAAGRGNGAGSVELAETLTDFIVAALEASVGLAGNTVLALARHPAQARLLRREPAHTAAAVEEGLRYDSPRPVFVRSAARNTTVGPVRVGAGAKVVVVVGAANRDPGAFAAPDTFDITRAPNRHLGFGVGPPSCLGAALARLQAQFTVASLFTRFPTLDPVDDPVWEPRAGRRLLARLVLSTR